MAIGIAFLLGLCPYMLSLINLKFQLYALYEDLHLLAVENSIKCHFKSLQYYAFDQRWYRDITTKQF